MPSTYNGIGTHYYGQRNVQTRVGVCNSCKRQVNLKSYDTRLWFVVVFIPIIPLGRKRITDYCSSCSRHYVAPLHKWEAAKQLGISGALQEFHQDPSPDNAIRVHQQLAGFRQYNEAAEFRKIIGPQFHDNARVQSYLGEELSAIGQHQEAQPYYRRALELRPDMPQAAVGVARDEIRHGRLDEAHSLLAFLEQPGAAQMYSLEPLEILANAYQNAGRHADALPLYRLILIALPAVGLHEGFRKKVKTSESALKSKPSILPKKKFSLGSVLGRGGGSKKGKLIVGAAVVFVIALIAAGVNEYTRRHRTLYIVNGFDKPATVNIDGIGNTVVDHKMASVVLPEGKYHAHISGPVDQNVDFEIISGYFGRWGGSPAWLLNVGGAALIEEKSGHYKATDPRPTDYNFFFGQSFTMFPQIDHPFAALPHSTELDSSETEKTLTNLDFAHEKPVDVIGYLADHGRTPQALQLAQWDLHLHPDDVQVLYTYASIATQGPAHAQFIQFLQAGLDHRPVAMEWHRFYQENMKGTPGGDANLRATYDAMLQKDPGNSALIYLRGRIAASREQGLDFFNRALTADPKNAYAYYALGYDAMARGEWQEARPLLAHAVEYGSDVASFRPALLENQFALRDYAAAESDARSHLQKNPLDAIANTYLMYALVAESRPAEAEQAVTKYEGLLLKAGETTADPGLRLSFLYATGKDAEIGKFPASNKDAKILRCYLLMEAGKPADAEKLVPPGSADDDEPFFDLAVATSWLLQGDSTHAAPWLDRAAKALQDSGDDDLQHFAKILTDSTPPTIDELKPIDITVQSKSLLAAYLALRYPAHGAEFATFAGHYNILLSPPHRLIAQVVAKISPAP